MAASRPVPVWLRLLLLPLGVLAGLAAPIWLGRTIAFVRQADEAPGKVVRLESRGRHGGASMRKSAYYPVFEFTDATGTKHEVRSSIGSRPPSYKRGEAITVLYRPAAPEDARIKSFFSLWVMPIVVAALGVLVAGRCLVSLVRTIRALAMGVPSEPRSA